MEQQTFDLPSAAKKTGPVMCLGMTFPDEAARRAHFTALLAEKLKDSEFRKIEGFPLGTDEDILALSDPPYYCACPNPWIDDFLKEWEAAKPPKPMGYKYEREPFAADVSEGKNDPIYNAHSYHTKVPHKAIMRYILHYTEPGDIVFDGFCGTGMTGVAAQLCGDIEQVRSLGYKVDEKTGAITDPNAEDPKKVISHLGARKAMLNDLSPEAFFISMCYTNMEELLKDVEILKADLINFENQYKTLYVRDGEKVLHGVWSDVFVCPHCQNEIVFWDVAVVDGKLKDSHTCPKCKVKVGKAVVKDSDVHKMCRAYVQEYDPVVKAIVKKPKMVLVQEGVKAGTCSKNCPVSFDRISQLMDNSRDILENCFVPLCEFPPGRQTNKLINGSGIHYIHEMYTPRALAVIAKLWAHKAKSESATRLLRFCLSGINNYISRKQGFFGGGGGVAGTLFTPSIHLERNVFDVLNRKLKKLVALKMVPASSIVSCSSSTQCYKEAINSLDYIFIDPPFGENLQYSELNSFIEYWQHVFTAGDNDCVMNYVAKKDIEFYREVISKSFSNFYRLIKPGRWMTVEFSNTSASIWNSIQTALTDAGFVVASVNGLDKQQKGFNAIMNPVSVKQDLVITAYKPDENFEARFKLESETEDGVWDFVRTHLSKLPVCKVKSGKLITIPERDPRILFDQVVSYYVRKNLNVPISSRDFQEGLSVRYSQRDGMFFLPEQAAEYDKKKALQKYEVDEGAALFIHDEASAISWLRSVLGKKPQTYSSVQPQYLQAPTSISKHEELPDLRELLKDNFLCYDAAKDGDVPSQIHTLLSTNYHELRNLPKDNPQLKEKADGMWYVPDPNKASDLEKLREKSLLKEFEAYRAEKKLKKFRLEVVRAGFKKAFADKDFATILGVGAKIPEDVINEDDKLLMWYNIAQRLGGR